MGSSTYTDDELRRAVGTSHSWRGVLRSLGLKATSSQALRSVRRNADRAGISYAHFTGQRRWSTDDLAAAVASSRSWGQVAVALGLAGGSSSTALKGHAARLGIDTSHMTGPAPVPTGMLPMRVETQQLPRSGSMIAAAWFSMCGYSVSWPLEPCRYDLAVEHLGNFLRVQVKTSRTRRSGSWVVTLTSTSALEPLYDPDEIDYFFIVDGDLDCYLIPVSCVGGLHSINTSAYSQFRLSRDVDQPT